MGWLHCWISKVCCSVLQLERSNEIEAVSTGLSRDSREVCTLQNRLAPKLRRMNYTGGLVMEAC